MSGVMGRNALVLVVLFVAANVALLAVDGLRNVRLDSEIDVRKWSVSFGRGFLRRSYRDETGAEHRYIVFAPQHDEGDDPLPIILFLCGFGEYGDDGVHHLVNTLGPQLWDQRARFPCVAVFPQCRAGSNWTAGSPDVQWAMDMLDATAAEFQTDPDRVYLTGASSGGAGAWSVAAAYPERFAAVAPLCGGASSGVAACATAGLPHFQETCGPSLGGVRRPAPNGVQSCRAPQRRPAIAGPTSLRASTTCGCSVVHNLKSTLAPGESTECTIEFHASNRRGPSTVVVLFRFDVVGTSHDHPASVFADVRPSVIYSPAALHFKADPSAGHQSAHVEFTDTTRSELALSSAACSHNAFSARISDPVAAESGELSAPATVGVEITFDPLKWSSTPQNNRAALIVYTDSQFDSYLTVPLYVDR